MMANTVLILLFFLAAVFFEGIAFLAWLIRPSRNRRPASVLFWLCPGVICVLVGRL